MSFAASSGARIAYVAEATFGTTPATPAFKVFRTTGGGPRTSKTTITSDEIRADRNVPDESMVGMDVAGAYPFEFSYGTFDDMLDGALMGAWASDVLKNGVTPKSFTFEETLELGATDSFSRFSGCMVNTFSLSVSAREKVTGSIGLMGQKEELDTAVIEDATYTAANAEPILSASGNIASLAVASLDPAPKLRSVSFEVNNDLRTRPVVGSLYSEEFGLGRCNVTGTLNAYFGSNALYQAVLDHGGGALSFTIGKDAGKKYTFLFPKIVFLNGERQVGGNSDDVMVNIPFRAVYDAAEACSIKITRAVA
ncbi:phage tail tube protein [Ancylobacter sp. MQZ15Z-1]|uniref:Phage tail tube protein n=1 Tax=Ancylobacter mangrovi TaxID=2972472 RepID=A0A9X2PQ99_9HYPH|nr:phage tail tube protein [Ancylobacter mangrovi]MCS0497863.1 phage tail tube protein [Ancylobacter mangrovi]